MVYILDVIKLYWPCVIYISDITSINFADPCDPNPCAPHGTCVHDLVNISGYTCTCDAGWTGTNCQTGRNR